MNITKTKAVELATEFVKKDKVQADFPIAYETGHAILNRKKRSMSWVTVVEEGEEYWSVYFDLKINDPAIATVDPNHVAVMVSSQSEKIEWLPLL
ncbi:hypothetical protein DU002_19180 [Corallincola holothuriorum]|uniref:Uncharacterized protein n=1 Tax=Corallincola holothuriorum TaxID=2282215 RepID=A0A368MXF4_9GAMM|nr:hypothetical protein [Corallincola holothuriorum]RCU42868.1 hypothetical protein DU002_19180 [Corallincola holothuriorum]